MSDVHMELDKVDQAGNDTPPPPEPEDKPSGSNRSKSKTTAGLVRETGKSLLPISRVQKIIKADKVRSLVLTRRACKVSSSMSFQELPTVAKEAAFLISLATEEFIKRLSEASHHIAHREKRVTVQQRDIGAILCSSNVAHWLTGPRWKSLRNTKGGRILILGR
jgi:DNA polymerase epsilon subunit 4